MGRKNHGKAHGRVKLPVQETNEEEGVPKISPQKRSEVKNLVGKLLKVTSTILPTPNASKEWEIHLEIEKLLEKINKLESDMKIPISDRDTRIEEFINWMKENGAEIDGIKIAQFPGYGYGIKAEKNFAQGDLLIAVPRKVMLTTENVGDSLLGPLMRTDPMLQHMPNVALSLLLLIEKFKPDSFWKPYIAVLPAEYTTVLYFKTNELQELKGSPSLEPALKQCRNIARQYAYFSNLFQQSTDPGIASLREVFTYEQYCWAVSTVMTRQNFVPSSDGKSMLTALIPMWDMCNHTNGKLSTDFNAVQDRSECMACRDYQAGEQIFIFYGPRTNSELFVHNGFVYPDNEHDGLRLKLGVSREDPLQPERSKLLCRLGIPAAGDFWKGGPIPIRVVAVGDGAVGKTCMLLVFKGDPYPEDYEPTIFENHHEMRTFEGRQYCLHLWDTAGQQEYDRLRPMSYSKCDVVLICFALDSPETLRNVTAKWFVEVKEYCPKAAVLLVGTKSDLWDQKAPDSVTQAQIDLVAAQTHAFRFIPCSAKKNENIGDVFDLAIGAVLAKNPKGCSVA